MEIVPKAEYDIKKENIIPLDNSSEQLKNFPDWRKKLGWTYELRAGSGRVISETKEFEIRYVKGDKFIVYAVIIHELGHLRQEQFNGNINKIDKDKEHGKYIEALELDAQERGWQRIKNYHPDFLKQLEEQFEKYKAEGKFAEFDSFKDLYIRLNEGSVSIDNAINSLSSEDEDNEEKQYEALKNAGVDKFFAQMNSAQIGQIVDTQEAEEVIMKIGQEIAREK